jgi:hypothetical protein
VRALSAFPDAHRRLRRVRSGQRDQVHDLPAAPERQPGDPDIFGAQQYAPLLDIEVPMQ